MKIENRKLEWNAQPKTKMVNENYTPGGGDKKVRTIVHVIIDTWQMDVPSERPLITQCNKSKEDFPSD